MRKIKGVPPLPSDKYHYVVRERETEGGLYTWVGICMCSAPKADHLFTYPKFTGHVKGKLTDKRVSKAAQIAHAALTAHHYKAARLEQYADGIEPA